MFITIKISLPTVQIQIDLYQQKNLSSQLTEQIFLQHTRQRIATEPYRLAQEKRCQFLAAADIL